MASSGSFNTSGYATDHGTACLTFAWSIKSQDPATNQTVINWSVKGAGLDSGHMIKAGGFKVVINGQTVYSKSTDYRIELYTGTVVASGTATITHNADGTKTFSASVEAGVYYYAVNCSGSGSWALTTIPRYAKITTFKVASKTETTATFTWGADVACENLRYSLNGGSWLSVSGYPNFTITGLSHNTNYSVKIRVTRKDSQLTTDSTALSFTTYNYPHLTAVETANLKIGNSQKLTLYNPLSRAVTIKMYKDSTSGTLLYSGTTSTTSIKFTPTESTLYATIPSSQSSKCVYSAIYGNSVRTTTGSYTYGIKGTETPIFSNFTYKDTNTDIVSNITGDDQLLIKGYSKLTVSISADNKMTAVNSASPLNYIADIYGQREPAAYSTANIDIPMGTIKVSGIRRLLVSAYDSRGLHKSAYKDIVVIDYDKPIINADIKRLNNFEAQTTLKVSGTYSRVTIDDTDKNSILSVEYRYREIGGEWGKLQPLTATLMSGEFTCNEVILSLDNSKAFEFEIQVTDKIATATLTATVDVGQAVFFISTNKKACYVNGVEIPTFNTVYPIGSVYCNSTNTNPSEIYGGTWTLIDKGFKAGSSLISQAATTYLSTFRVASVRSGNTIRLRINVTTAQALSEDTVTLGMVDLAQHGLAKDEGGAFFLYTVYSGVSMSDGANAVILLYLTTGGLLQIADSFTSDGVHSLPAGTPFYFDITLPLLPNQMADEFCNKFYWQRTA